MQESNSLLRPLEFLDLVRNDERELGHLLDLVSLALDKSGHARCSDGRNQSVAALVPVDLSMPAAPDTGRGETTSTSAHVSERTLTGTVSTTSTDARNTGHGATSTPRLSTCLVS